MHMVIEKSLSKILDGLSHSIPIFHLFFPILPGFPDFHCCDAFRKHFDSKMRYKSLFHIPVLFFTSIRLKKELLQKKYLKYYMLIQQVLKIFF